MKIEKIHINGFGKFKDKTIEFKDGFNLIYGENEAGKSTLHKFIEGMFFGFFKNYSKNKYYTPDYNKYLPWECDMYGGSVEFENDERKYRIERNLSRRSESFKLFDNITGEDLTNTLPYDPVIRQHSISSLIGLNKVLFNNTMSIKQLGTKTDDDFKKEISEALSNYEKGASGAVSVNKAIERLEMEKSKIGTKKQSRSDYGKAIIEVEKLEKKKELYEKIQKENRDKYVLRREKELKIRELEKRKEEILSDISDLDLVVEKDKYFKYKEIENENKDLMDRINELEKYKNVSDELYSHFLDLDTKNNVIKENINNINDKIDVLGEKKSVLDEYVSRAREKTKGKNYNKILLDMEALKDRMNAQKKLDEKYKRQKNENFEMSYNKSKNKNRVVNILLILGILMSLLLMVLSVTFEDKFLTYVYISSVVTAAVFLAKIFSIKGFKKLSDEFKNYNFELVRTENMIELNKIEIDKMLKSYDEKNADDLSVMLEEKSSYAKDIAYKQNQIDKYDIDIDDLRIEIESLRKKQVQFENKMSVILSNNSIESKDDFKNALAFQQEYVVDKNKYASNLKILSTILSKEDVERLEKKFATEDSYIDKDRSISSKNQMNFDLDSISDEINNLKNDISRIDGELNSTVGVDDICVIEEEINKYRRKIDLYEENLEALNKAIATINEISKNIHLSVAPSINEVVGGIVNKITKGKYSVVKVDEEMHVSILDLSTNKMIDVSGLSNGTIDQIYFALRLSVMDNLLVENNVPVILDDCFVQYDEERLYNALKVLVEQSLSRQIIAFTCHNREEQILSEIGVDYNKILL